MEERGDKAFQLNRVNIHFYICTLTSLDDDDDDDDGAAHYSVLQKCWPVTIASLQMLYSKEYFSIKNNFR